MKGFIRTVLAVMVGLLLAATAWAGPMVDAHLDEMGAQNDALQVQVDEHALALEALTARHGDAQAALAAAEAARAVAQASLDALNAQLAMEQAADDDEHLNLIEGAVVDFYGAVAPHYLELVASHGVEGAATLIAERMGVDPSVVAPLLLQPMEVPAEGGEADAEEPAEAPDATDDSAGESGAEGSDTSDE